MENLDKPIKTGINSDGTLSDEAAAAVAFALYQELNDEVHDRESYIITIRRRH